MAKQRVTLTEKEQVQIGRQLGARFESLILKKFVTHRSFLVATGVNERQFFRFIRGGNPGLRTVYLFAKAAGVPLIELFDFDTSREIFSWEDDPNRKNQHKERYGKGKMEKEEYERRFVKKRLPKG